MKILSAVIDRIRGDTAIVTFEGNRSPQSISLKELPKGVKEGDWLSIAEDNGVFKNIEIDQQKRISMEQAIADKLKQLRNK